MCRSQAEGGQRCASHAKAKYLAAKEAYRVAAMDYMEGPETNGQVHVDAFNAARQARVEYASTPQGEAELTALADRTGNTEIRQDVAKGVDLRARNTEVLRHARRGAARSTLMRAARDRVTATGANRAWMHAAETKALHARFDQFTLMAEDNTSLRAPASFTDQAKATANRAHLSSLGRAATYGLWRSQRTGADFAPPAPAGTEYRTTVTSWDDLRPGDVISEPGYRAPSDVEHEGKVVADVTPHIRGGHTVRFTDRSTATRNRSVFTVLRPTSEDHEKALAAYDKALLTATDTGSDDQGWYAVDADTGEKVYHP